MHFLKIHFSYVSTHLCEKWAGHLAETCKRTALILPFSSAPLFGRFFNEIAAAFHQLQMVKSLVHAKVFEGISLK